MPATSPSERNSSTNIKVVLKIQESGFEVVKNI
jgi:hypothetical protein